LLNGLNWERKSSSLAKQYILELDKSVTSGNKIDRIRLNGFNTSNDKDISQTIRTDIKNKISKQQCIVLGTNKSCDHKDGRKIDERIMHTKTQVLGDFYF